MILPEIWKSSFDALPLGIVGVIEIGIGAQSTFICMMGCRLRNTSLHVDAQWASRALAELDEVSFCDANLPSNQLEHFFTSDIIKVVRVAFAISVSNTSR